MAITPPPDVDDYAAIEAAPNPFHAGELSVDGTQIRVVDLARALERVRQRESTSRNSSSSRSATGIVAAGSSTTSAPFEPSTRRRSNRTATRDTSGGSSNSTASVRSA